ncbi:MAG: hypothetical protein ACUZ8N_01570 [Candidatus Scalindua sp.]
MTSPVFEISHQSAEESREIAQIHVSLLPESPLSNLGVDFLDRCYYRKMIEDDEFVCLVAKFNGKISGFLTGSFDEKGVVLRCIKKNYGYFIINTLRLILNTSLNIKSILNVLKNIKEHGIAIGQNSSEYEHLKVRCISVAVLPEYRTREFVKKHRVKVGVELFTSWVRLLQEKGIEAFRFEVLKSNTLAVAFYHILGIPIKGENHTSQGDTWVYVGNTGNINTDQKA